ncbi:hypothetical protein JIG36_05165 [Actinoplanes sp. LDG1-06]|uniref:CBM-cenC domain-containing protein n=1 Tax=Paractinoplanes ovalisporus TaxID=2810368 RepID=A0ABS2A6M4_9ACTN|nr:hypothetical protein [Actinoplanes ovalisporus]
MLVAGSLAVGQPVQAAPACTGQIVPNHSFERGSTGWTAGPRTVVVADQARPAHTGRAYAALAGLDVTRTEVVRTTVTVPAGCNVTLGFWARVSTTETARGDYLNVGLSITGTPPKTLFSLTFDHSQQWQQHTSVAGVSATERTATVSFAASETAGNGVTAFDVDDVTLTLS